MKLHGEITRSERVTYRCESEPQARKAWSKLLASGWFVGPIVKAPAGYLVAASRDLPAVATWLEVSDILTLD